MNSLTYLESLQACTTCDNYAVFEECSVCYEEECKSCKDSYGCLEMAWTD